MTNDGTPDPRESYASAPLDKQIDDILEEFGYAIVNHPEASRASHIRTYKAPILELLAKAEKKGRMTAARHLADTNFVLKDYKGDDAISLTRINGYLAHLEADTANIKPAPADTWDISGTFPGTSGEADTGEKA